MRRLLINGVLVRCKRLTHPTQIEQGVASVGTSGMVAQRLGAPECLNRLLKTPFGVEQDAVHVMRFRLVRIARQRPAQPSPCAGNISLGGAKLAPGNVGLHLVGIQRKGLAEVGLGFDGTATLAFQHAQVDPAGDQVWAQLDGAEQGSFGVDFAALFAQQASEIHPGCGKVGTSDKCTAVAGFSFFEATHAGEDEAGGKLGLGQARPEAERALVTVECLLVAAGDGKCVAQTQVRGHKGGLAADGQFEIHHRLVGAAGCGLQFAQPQSCKLIHAVKPDSLAIGGLSLLRVSRSLERLAQRHPGRAHGRSGLNGRFGHLYRRLGLVAGQGHQAHANQCLRMMRVGLECALIAEGDLGKTAGEAVGWVRLWLARLGWNCRHGEGGRNCPD